ncbi:serine hydrolase domain-containing protein [Mucilaginibacter sp. NFX135]|uniref:serine hydrolase domain-containing protein n=1 Tax=Mucilaginibacter sp. NFX135 TaxID=3402687 RepID=UPI003AFA5D27
MKTFLTSFISLFMLMGLAFAQTDTVQSNLLKDIPVWMTEYHVPCVGVGVGVIENGKIKWMKNFGELQKGHSAPKNTLFNIASQTKPVTAMMTLKLVETGQWDLDEPLAHYWIDPDIAGNPYLMKLTTRLVLSHQTGFPNWRLDNGSTKLYFKFEPGTASGYSGEGFEYLRRALEAKFHKSLAALMDSLLFKPLGMKDTYYWNDRLDTSRFAMWHDGQGKRYNTSIQTPINAADDLITTIADYCRLGIYTMDLVDKGSPIYGEMIKPQRRTKPGNASGLGWGLVDGLPDGGYALQHGGSDIGVRTMAVFLPKSKNGIVVMTNADNGEFICDRIIKRALTAGTQILATMNRSATSHERIVIADKLIEGYTGTYEQSNGKLVKVEKEGNALKISGDGVPTVVVFPESANKFFMEGYDVQLQFPDVNSMIVFEGGKQVLKVNRK